mmetsp:Transcript_13966/g.34522  ORF Transcript_13966/g.34522 Transcript_13966/m.34522 type:complete len:414 (-) Transcript_13966:378-1619(-)
MVLLDLLYPSLVVTVARTSLSTPVCSVRNWQSSSVPRPSTMYTPIAGSSRSCFTATDLPSISVTLNSLMAGVSGCTLHRWKWRYDSQNCLNHTCANSGGIGWPHVSASASAFFSVPGTTARLAKQSWNSSSSPSLREDVGKTCSTARPFSSPPPSFPEDFISSISSRQPLPSACSANRTFNSSSVNSFTLLSPVTTTSSSSPGYSNFSPSSSNPDFAGARIRIMAVPTSSSPSFSFSAPSTTNCTPWCAPPSPSVSADRTTGSASRLKTTSSSGGSAPERGIIFAHFVLRASTVGTVASMASTTDLSAESESSRCKLKSGERSRLKSGDVGEFSAPFSASHFAGAPFLPAPAAIRFSAVECKTVWSPFASTTTSVYGDPSFATAGVRFFSEGISRAESGKVMRNASRSNVLIS